MMVLWVSQISVKFMVRFSTTRRDWQDLAVKLDSFCISVRSHQDFEIHKLLTKILTQSFPDGMNNFLRWLAFCFSVPFQMWEAQKWSKDALTWIGFIYQNILFNKLEWSDLTLLWWQRDRCWSLFKISSDNSFVVRIEILFFLLAVGADLSWVINGHQLSKKITFQNWLSRGRILFLFSSLFLEQHWRQTD